MRADDLGTQYDGPAVATRVVSLVPSITEALATDRRTALVGATDWCTHPADLDVSRVRGTKNPDLRAVLALEPDLVVANKEENRELDVRRLREAGVAVWVTDIQTVPQALDSLDRLYEQALGWPRPDWLVRARSLWSGPVLDVTQRVAVAIWRDPWMVVGSNTYTGDLVRRLGWENGYDASGSRYPKVEVADLDRAGLDCVLLPDEPYVFTEDDGPEAFARTRTRLVSGRMLTWYGPAMVKAHDTLAGEQEGLGVPDWGTDGMDDRPPDHQEDKMDDMTDQPLGDDDMTTEPTASSGPGVGGDADGTDGDATDTTDGDTTDSDGTDSDGTDSDGTDSDGSDSDGSDSDGSDSDGTDGDATDSSDGDTI